MSNDEITPHIEDFQIDFKELIERDEWKNHQIYLMDQTGLSVEILTKKVYNFILNILLKNSNFFKIFV